MKSSTERVPTLNSVVASKRVGDRFATERIHQHGSPLLPQRDLMKKDLRLKYMQSTSRLPPGLSFRIRSQAL